MPKILALTSNPQSSASLRLDAEIREIKVELESAPNFVFDHRGAARPDDLLELLETVRPDILHFSGHGTKERASRSAIVMEDENGNAANVSAATLKRIFKSLKYPPRCVFLNSCYSVKQVDAIKPYVDTIVGARDEIFDKHASIFAAAFYRWLGRNCSVSEAFARAATQLTVAGGDPHSIVLNAPRGPTPRFFARPELHAEFVGTRSGKLMSKDEHYNMLLWIEGAEDFATSVIYEICDDSFDEWFWEVTRKEDRLFKTYDFRTMGQVTIRNVVWTQDGRGIGVSSTLTEALLRRYGSNASGPIRKAINRLVRR
jgi:hypothetical protein